MFSFFAIVILALLVAKFIFPKAPVFYMQKNDNGFYVMDLFVVAYTIFFILHIIFHFFSIPNILFLVQLYMNSTGWRTSLNKKRKYIYWGVVVLSLIGVIL